MTLPKRIFTAARLLPALLVAALTLATTARAVQTISTPNAALYSYNLAPNTNSGAIFPVANQAVHVMGVQLTTGFRGVGHVTMLRIAGQFLEWVGLESPSAAAITSGFSGSSGVHILWLDYSHTVDIRVNNADSFVVHNGNSINPATGNVTLIW